MVNSIDQSLSAAPVSVPLRERLGELAAKTVQSVVQDSFDRLTKLRSNYDAKALSGGIWFQHDYYDILKKYSNDRPEVRSRLNYCIEHDMFWNIFAPPSLLDNIPHPNELSLSARLRLSKTAKPSDVLKGLLVERQLAFLDCQTVCQLGHYNALYQVLGERKFDVLFSNPKIPFRLSNFDESENPLLYFMKLTAGKTDTVGQHVWFKNMPLYKIKHNLMGMSVGYHMLILDTSKGEEKKKFIGLGLPPEGLTEEEVEQLLVDEHNKPPQNCLSLSKATQNKLLPLGIVCNLAICKLAADPSEENKRFVRTALSKFVPSELIENTINEWVSYSKPITKEEAKQSEGFGLWPSVTREFNTDIIQRLIDLPDEEVSLEKVSNWFFSNKS